MVPRAPARARRGSRQRRCGRITRRHRPAIQRNASIAGDLVTWDDARNGTRVVCASGGDILLFDLATGGTTAVCTAPGEQGQPRITGRRITWEERGGADAHVSLFDLETWTERRMTGADLADPDLGGGVTFLAPDGAAQRTFRAAITGGTPRAVDAIPGEHRAQRIDGARVAVEAGGGIWVYEMNLGTATQLTANGCDGTDASPAIDGARVASETDRNGNRDIYVAAVDGWAIGVPATVPPMVAPTTTAASFGARRYVVGGRPQRPSVGATVGSTVFGSARPRAVVGTGTETGTSPPATRFVRWSPIARW